jgi:hypothetical protein
MLTRMVDSATKELFQRGDGLARTQIRRADIPPRKPVDRAGQSRAGREPAVVQDHGHPAVGRTNVRLGVAISELRRLMKCAHAVHGKPERRESPVRHAIRPVTRRNSNLAAPLSLMGSTTDPSSR